MYFKLNYEEGISISAQEENHFKILGWGVLLVLSVFFFGEFLVVSMLFLI